LLGQRSLASYAERQQSCQARSALALFEGCGFDRLARNKKPTLIQQRQTRKKSSKNQDIENFIWFLN
jgi:hypothetical protein